MSTQRNEASDRHNDATETTPPRETKGTQQTKWHNQNWNTMGIPILLEIVRNARNETFQNRANETKQTTTTTMTPTKEDETTHTRDAQSEATRTTCNASRRKE